MAQYFQILFCLFFFLSQFINSFYFIEFTTWNYRAGIIMIIIFSLRCRCRDDVVLCTACHFILFLFFHAVQKMATFRFFFICIFSHLRKLFAASLKFDEFAWYDISNTYCVLLKIGIRLFSGFQNISLLWNWIITANHNASTLIIMRLISD